MRINWTIGLMSRVFVNGPVDQGSALGRVKPKIKYLIITQRFKVWIKDKVKQSREWSSVLP